MKGIAMINLPGYEVIGRIHESVSSLVLRARREADGLSVILKVLKGDYPSPEEVERYRREYEITRDLCCDGAICALDLLQYGHIPVLVLEDFGGQDLKSLIKERPLTLRELLYITIQAVDVLARIHEAGYVHQDIKPANLVYDSETKHLKLIDFGSAVRLTARGPAVEAGTFLTGTLAYISPEQTGRMNRVVDWRTDFYSLGVTLYELLTGRLPFESNDPMELVHAHIAKPPRPPHEIAPEAPPGISHLVMKLLSKDAEDRYSSAAGLKADLEEAVRLLETYGRIDRFPLGRWDVSDRFKIPAKLYGRDRELAALNEAFDRVSRGPKEMVVVTGGQGIGKTALVREAGQRAVARGGRFISGHFEPPDKNVPYSALTMALKQLAFEIMTEGRENLSRWRDRLLAALGSNGRIVTDMIPEFKALLGEQPRPAELEPAAARNRLKLVLQDLLRVFCRPEHPLILFLDFLDWADPACRSFLTAVLSDPETDFLLVVGPARLWARTRKSP